MKTIGGIRSEYTGISSQKQCLNHCRRKSKVFDPTFDEVIIFKILKKNGL